jgi:predicted DNA-binding transcriptional regulator AlpA
MRRLGVKSSAFDEIRKRPDFPKPIFIPTRSPGWLEHELNAYLDRFIAERDDQKGTSHEQD